MLSRQQIKFITSLQQKKFRKEHQCFVAEGNKLVEELLQSRFVAQNVFASEAWIQKNKQLTSTKAIQTFAVSENEFSRISSLKTANQALAVFKIPQPLFDPQIAKNEIVIMLDDISDPGNLGTILRTADWFGIHHLICSAGTVDLFNPKTVQATMGSIARVNVYYLDLQKILAKTANSVPVFGSVLNGKPLAGIEIPTNGIILIGNEAHGISPELHAFISHPVFIPASISGGSGFLRPESLNAAVATAILCWEFKRNKYL